MSLHILTPMADSIIVDQGCRSYVVTLHGLDTRVNLIFLDMLDFDFIWAWTGYFFIIRY